MPSPQPGMTGLTHISGAAGAGIRFGQFLNREGFSRWEHAFKLLPGGLVLEAEPGGAVIREMPYAGRDVYWCHGLFKLAAPQITGDYQLMEVARQLEHTPYSFLDYGALAARRLRLYPLYPLLKQRITSQRTMICSQLCDEFDRRMGAHDFTDDRWPGDVTPGGLWKRDLELLS